MHDETTKSSHAYEPTHKLGSLIKPDPTLRLAWGGFRRWTPPVWLMLSGVCLIVLTWLPLAVAVEMRTNKQKRDPRIHFIQDMDNQPRLEPQDDNILFADSRATRPRVPGTVARGELVTDSIYENGYAQAPQGDAAPTFADQWPAQVQAKLNDPVQAEAFLKLGQVKFNLTCAMCHGVDGQGNGPIAQRAAQVGATQTGWVQPSNINDDVRRSRPIGHLYNTVNNGIRKMGGYGTQLKADERWAVVAYVRTLQLAHAANPSVLTEEQRRGLQ